MARMVRGLSAAAVVIGGTLAGFFGYQLWQSRSQSAAGLPADAGGAPLTPAIPEQLPDLTLPDLSGQNRALRSFLGHPLIVNFWATWCAPCRREIPLLQQLRSQYRVIGLEIVGIAVDFRPAVRDYLTRTSVSYPLLIGEDQGMMAAEKFGMQPVLPFSVFVQPEGQILVVKVGELHQDEADDILRVQQALIAGHIDLQQARSTIAERLQILAIERARAAAH